MFQRCVMWYLFVLLTHHLTASEKRQSLACAGETSCNNLHQLTCKGTQYISITGASYGYKQDCLMGIGKTDCNKNETKRCCEQGDDSKRDCLLVMLPSTTDFLRVRNSCADRSSCTFKGITNVDNRNCEGRKVNSYSKLEYTCIESSNKDEGAVVGGVVAVIIIGVIILIVSVILWKRRLKNNADKQESRHNRTRVTETPNFNQQSVGGYTEVDLPKISTMAPSSVNYSEIKDINIKKPCQGIDSTAYVEYNHLGEDKSASTKTRNDNYNHITTIKQSDDDNYHHIDGGLKPVVASDSDYHQIGDVDKMVENNYYHTLGDENAPEVNASDNYNHIGQVRFGVSDVDNQHGEYNQIELGNKKTQPNNRYDYAKVNK